MSELHTLRLDELITQGAIHLGRGDVISKDDIATHPGPYPIYSSSAQNNGKFGEYGKYMFDEELITWSVDGGGHFFYRDRHQFSVTNVCGFMRVNAKLLHPKFVFYSLAHQHRSLTFDYTDKAHPSVIRKQYRLPDIGMTQQKRIASFLTSIDTTIEKTEALIAKHQQIKAGLMHDLFTRGVLPNGQLRPPRSEAPQLYQETAVGWVPSDWEVVQMHTLAEDRKGSTTIGPFGSDLVAADYRTEGAPVVFVRDVKESGFQWNSDTYVSQAKAWQLRAHKVRSGEVLATKMGLPPCISCVYPEWMPDGVITADMIRLTPDTKRVNAAWLAAAINHDRVMRQVAAITAGVTRPKVTLADFRSIRIALPRLEEQQLVNSQLSLVERTIAAEMDRTKKLQKQKLGLMQDLLTGRVPVPVHEPEPVNA